MLSSRLVFCLALVSLVALVLSGCTQQSAPANGGVSSPSAPAAPSTPSTPSIPSTPSAPAKPSAPSAPAKEQTTAPTIPTSVNQTNISPAAPSNKSEPLSAPAKPAPVIVRGTPDADFELMAYNENLSQAGTTLFPDNHISGKPRIVEVNALCEIVWKYDIPAKYAQFTNPGFDVELLANGNILYMLPRKGIFELSRDGKTVWSYFDSKISHDADRLPNGNTLMSFGASDTKNDMQAKEIDQSGKIVWSYKAAKDFDKPPYSSISEEGWTHSNAVSRLANGNTLISMRNFNLLAEVSPSGELVRTINLSRFLAQHDPEVQANGNILIANHVTPNEVFEFTPAGDIIWNFTIKERTAWPARDVNKLSNGNILITGADRIIEITLDGTLVWGLQLRNVAFTRTTSASLGFYKAERLNAE